MVEKTNRPCSRPDAILEATARIGTELVGGSTLASPEGKNQITGAIELHKGKRGAKITPKEQLALG